MKRSDRLFVIAALAIGTVLCSLFFFFSRDAGPVGEKLSECSKPVVEIALANRTLCATGFPVRFSEHQTLSVRGTAAYVLALAEGVSKIEAIRIVHDCGARVIGPLTSNALLIETSVFSLARLSTNATFSASSEWLPEDKVSARLKPLLEAGGETIDVTVVALASADIDPLVKHVLAQGGERVTGCLNGKSSVALKLPRALVLELAQRGDVRWMEPFNRPKLLNDVAVGPTAMNVRTVWETHGLTGQGQVVTTSDSGIDTGNLATMHADLRNRVIGFKVADRDSCNTYDANGHGTHTAGSIVGDGTLSGGTIRGTAYGAKLWAWFCGGANDYIYTPDSYDDLFRPTGATNACIHSASWGNDDEGAYSSQSHGMDEYVWEHPDFLPVVANGNAGSNSQTVGSPATAKNVLAVGATQNVRSDHGGGHGNGDPSKVVSFSSRGPCADGRIKPDLCSPGVGIVSTRSFTGKYAYGIHSNTNYAYNSGTSMATPLTAGAAALVREWLVESRGFTNAPPTAALVKAVLTGGAKGVSVPDNDLGWGRVDLGESLYPSNRAVGLIDRIAFAEESSREFSVTLTNVAPFEVQLVWLDYPATEGASKTLVNDLDLIVSNKTTGVTWLGNGTRGGDHTNTVESVRITEAEMGDYAVIVRGTDVLYDNTEGGAAALYLRGAFADGMNVVDDSSEVAVRQIAVDAATGDDATATGKEDHPFATISAALASARAGNVLRVAPGVYAGGLVAPKVRVRIESTQGPESTVIDGGATNWCYDGSANESTVLSGFTLTNGLIDARYSFYSQYGAGAYGGILSNCVIVDCHIINSSSHHGNGSGGGAAFATLIDCRVESCSAISFGGGIYDCTADHCVIANCESTGPGGGASYSDLDNCTVRGCRAKRFRSSASEYAGGGVDCDCTCVNTILWDNLGPSLDGDNWEVYNEVHRRGPPMPGGVVTNTFVPSLSWCCTVPYNLIGEECLTDDPLFVSTNDFTDVRLYETSPCIGKGKDGLNIGAYSGTGIVRKLPEIDVKTATGAEVSNAVASVGYRDAAVVKGIGTNAETYAAFAAWSTNGLKSTAVVFSTRAYDSFLVRELVATPTLLGENNETKIELTALEPATDGTCSTTVRLIDGEEPVPLCSVKAAFAARTRVGAEPNGLEPPEADAISTESIDEGRAVKLTITPSCLSSRYFMRFDVK